MNPSTLAGRESQRAQERPRTEYEYAKAKISGNQLTPQQKREILQYREMTSNLPTYVVDRQERLREIADKYPSLISKPHVYAEYKKDLNPANKTGLGYDTDYLLNSGDYLVDDLATETRYTPVYEVWGVTKGNKRQRVLATYATKAEADAAAREMRYNAEVKVGKGSAYEVAVPGKEVGKEFLISAKPVQYELSYNEGQRSYGSYTPYQALIKDGKVVEETSFAVGQTQAGRAYRINAPYEEKKLIYQNGKLVSVTQQGIINQQMYQSRTEDERGTRTAFNAQFSPQIMKETRFENNEIANQRLYSSYRPLTEIRQKTKRNATITQTRGGTFLNEERNYTEGYVGFYRKPFQRATFQIGGRRGKLDRPLISWSIPKK